MIPPRRTLVCWIGAVTLLAGDCAPLQSINRAVSGPTVASHGLPWYMRETQMAPGGRLELKSKAWWTRAAALKIGESFRIDGTPDTGPMLVRREQCQTRGKPRDTIVWVIDDDRDGSLDRGGDVHDDCYVADYDADGSVDRLVDYIDNNADGKADEMDIRYFVGGELRNVWFGLDLDGDGHMWDVKGYEYSGNFFASDPTGDNMIYMNKFDPTRGEFVPISECPFAFFDTDGDGLSEIAVRVSGSPLSFDPAKDPDYANDVARYGGPWDDVMHRMGAMNVRYSFDIDNQNSPSTPLHYDMGFNLVGATPYDVLGDHHFNAKRRPPQTTRVIPHKSLRRFCDTYAARETGFTWHEQHDDTIAIGDKPDPKDDFRWEGVFWIWERRFMPNTGGPGQKWNVRREWSDQPANRRRLYYSAIDRRIHLYGAREGWIQVGHFAGLPDLGEIRMSDTDGNGYFDRWEVYGPTTTTTPGSGTIPLRVTTVHDERVTDLKFDFEELHRLYNQKILPEAIAANGRFFTALRATLPFEPPRALLDATEIGPDNMRRFAQDTLRELHYQHLRRTLTQRARVILAAAKMDDLRKLTPEQRDSTPSSHTAWQMLRALEQLDVAYGQGQFDEAEKILTQIAKLRAIVAP